MSDPRNDGGPAFPTSLAPDGAFGGLSARDWFASHYQIDEISKTWAEAVMGSTAPVWAIEDQLSCVRWWMEAEAKIRFMHADAMLAERKREPR